MSGTAADWAEVVVIAANRNAGCGAAATKVEALAERLAQLGLAVERPADLPGVVERTRELHAEGRLRAVIAAGGDGTAAEVANRTPPGTPLALFPLGTENLLAKYLQIPDDPVGAAEIVARGELVRFDAGLAGGRLFLLMVSCGFDAEVVRRMHQRRRGPIRHWNYAQPILESIRSYQYPEVRVYCESPDVPVAEPLIARWLFLFNLPCYARGLQLAPAATARDGLLDLCAFSRGSFWHNLRYLASVMRGSHGGMSDFRLVRARRFRLESDGEVPYQLDGDFGGYLPLEVEVLPERVALIVPSGGKAARSAAQLAITPA